MFDDHHRCVVEFLGRRVVADAERDMPSEEVISTESMPNGSMEPTRKGRDT
ncbi:hypothetical protein ABZ721_18915 [Streptomyces sp. NPDC006733]|uniref:hypothetical protein n=1 Tax=Streptomyces sp. NPDC006733 TaxID=3155460 RepID=UPI0033D8AC42